MVTTVHFYERRASRERRAAREALTEAARERHSALAAHFTGLAQSAQQSRSAAAEPVAAARK